MKNRQGFYAELKRSDVAEIKRRAKRDKMPQWKVISLALKLSRVRAAIK